MATPRRTSPSPSPSQATLHPRTVPAKPSTAAITGSAANSFPAPTTQVSAQHTQMQPRLATNKLQSTQASTAIHHAKCSIRTTFTKTRSSHSVRCVRCITHSYRLLGQRFRDRTVGATFIACATRGRIVCNSLTMGGAEWSGTFFSLDILQIDVVIFFLSFHDFTELML